MARKMAVLFLACGAVCRATPGWAEERGLVAHYTFDEGSGPIVHDRSDNHNDGKINGGVNWVKAGKGYALEFNGRDTCVDCGSDLSLDMPRAGAIEVWFSMKSIQGGLVTRSTGGGWGDERLVLAFNTWAGQKSFIWCVADGIAFQQRAMPIPDPEIWTHLVLTFDGQSIEAFQNGLSLGATAQDLTPEVKGAPLRIGRCEGLGLDYFSGLIAEVKLYNRSLSEAEAFDHYVASAKARGFEATGVGQVRVTPRFHARLGQLAVETDLRGLRPLPQGVIVEVELCPQGKPNPLRRKQTPVSSGSAKAAVLLSTAGLAAGDYEIRARALDSRAKPVGKAAVEKWTLPHLASLASVTGGAKVKVLNNLVSDLLNLQAPPTKPYSEWTFTNPRDGWVFIATTATVRSGDKLRVSLDAGTKEEAAIAHEAAGAGTLEAMRLLASGEHKLKVWTEGKPSVKSLAVRSVPELIFCQFQYDPHIPEFGPYDRAFVEKHIGGNINLIVGQVNDNTKSFLESWRAQGRKWIIERWIGKDETAEGVFKCWTTRPFDDPRVDGVILDEFGSGSKIWTEAVRMIRRDAQFKGKVVYPYCGSLYGDDLSREFIQAVIDSGYKFAWERYLQEQPTEAAAEKLLDATLTQEMSGWEKSFPGCAEHMIACLGYLVITESVNINPTVDYKVFMDMQFHRLATDPAFYGLYGLMEYTSGYADEETARWASRLYRHYGVEGNTELLSKRLGFKYKLDHITNPDFEEGTTGWTVSTAEEGSVATKTMKGYSWLQGRYPPTRIGNTFLWTRRSASKPNAVSQEVKTLQPGRLYSMKMITADYAELTKGKSVRQKHAVSVQIEGVELLPGKCFQSVVANNYAHGMGPFNAQNKAWLNFHWLVFRPKGTSARLSISDWAGPAEPGGPIGQELMYNFVEIQPYLED